MAKRRVSKWGFQGREFITVDDKATVGGTIGTDVFNADGTLFDPATEVTKIIEETDGGGASFGSILWSLILGIPQNVLNVVQGFPMVKIILPSGESLTIASDYQLIVYDSYDVIGDLTIEGDLVIL